MEKKTNIKGGCLEREEDKEKARNVNGREKKKNVSTLVYLEATSGRRRLRATHGGNPYTRVRPRRGSQHAHATTYALYAHSTRERIAITLSYGGDREHARAREREAR